MLPEKRRLFVCACLCIASLAAFPARGGDGEKVRYTARVTDMPTLRGVMSPTRELFEGDLETLHEWGANLVRFQIMRNWLKLGTERDLPEFDKWFDSRLDNLEKMLPVAKRLGIYFAVDFHTPPGGRSEGNIMRMFDEPEYADHFVEVWKRIAKRFKNHPDKDAIWAYDLLNEPMLSPEATARNALPELLMRAATAIREIDPDTVLLVSPARGGPPLSYVDYTPLPLEDVVYESHAYDPFFYTHQLLFPVTTPEDSSLVEYPGIIEDEFWSRSRLEKEFKPLIDFQKRYGARVYIGEFSTIAWAPNADVWLSDCIDIFEEYGWDWSYHSFREWEGFSLEHEGAPPDRFWPAQDNPRKRVFVRALKAK